MTLGPALGLPVEILFAAFGMAAVMTGLSALLPGFGDLALLPTGLMVAQGVAFYCQMARHLGRPARRRAGKTLMPQLELKGCRRWRCILPAGGLGLGGDALLLPASWP